MLEGLSYLDRSTEPLHLKGPHVLTIIVCHLPFIHNIPSQYSARRAGRTEGENTWEGTPVSDSSSGSNQRLDAGEEEEGGEEGGGNKMLEERKREGTR